VLREKRELVGVTGESVLHGLDASLVLEPEDGSVGGLEAVELLLGGGEGLGPDDGAEGLDRDVPELLVLLSEEDNGTCGL